MQQIFHHRITLTSLLILLFTASLWAQKEDEPEEFWSLVPGVLGDHLVMLDSSVVLVSVDWGFTPDSAFIYQNTIHLHHFSLQGDSLHTYTFNISEEASIVRLEVLRSLSRHKVHRLSNGKFLMGGHGITDSDDTTVTNLQDRPANGKQPTRFTFGKENFKEPPPMANPIIMTFNAALDSLERIDTLEAVPWYGNVTLIHEVAPDTLILSFHKRYPSNQVILETDSLFNVRWMSEDFGKQNYWEADIKDFLVTPEGDYLVSMYYIWGWTPNNMGYRKNILFKFEKGTGELLWEKVLWPARGINTKAVMAPWNDDKIVIALDDCCEYNNPFHEIIFHDLTGMHLQIRDYDGTLHQEISLRDFLWAYVKVFPGPSVFGDELEDPDEAGPWFTPHRIIRNSDNSYLVTGIQHSSNRMIFGRGFLLKLDEELQPIWARIYEIDKKNYPYGANYAYLYNVVQGNDQIFLGGSFITTGYWSSNSPLYPPNYPWDFFFRKDLFIPLDEYGCYEPGCHLTDNVPYYELEQAITLAPNPARGQVHIRIDHPALEHQDKVLFISDMQGQGMVTQRFSGNSTQVSLSGFAPGVYLVYIMSQGQVFRAERLVVGGE